MTGIAPERCGRTPPQGLFASDTLQAAMLEYIFAGDVATRAAAGGIINTWDEAWRFSLFIRQDADLTAIVNSRHLLG
ncbi:MAG: hypothetical protein V9G14_01395 [Cypionkella sp.]